MKTRARGQIGILSLLAGKCMQVAEIFDCILKRYGGHSRGQILEMVARLACDRPLIGVWPTIPSEVRFDSGDTGLGDRLLNALFAATLAKLGLFERECTCFGMTALTLHCSASAIRVRESVVSAGISVPSHTRRRSRSTSAVSSRAASRVAQSIRRVEAATSAKHSREQRLL